MFLEGEIVIVNEKAVKGLPFRVGTRAVILENQYRSLNYDYQVQFDDGETAPVKDVELNKLTEKDKVWMDYIFTGNKVLHNPSGEEVKILKADYLFGQAEVEFDDNSNVVVMIDCLRKIDKESDSLEEKHYAIGKFTEIALDIGNFTDEKNRQYGSSVDATHEMIKVLMERYTYDEENYLMPKSLLKHILLQVRMMDKQNRIFNNPSGKGDSESPYNDLAGYSLIGIDMVNNK
jgi:hypothetical protein